MKWKDIEQTALEYEQELPTNTQVLPFETGFMRRKRGLTIFPPYRMHQLPQDMVHVRRDIERLRIEDVLDAVRAEKFGGRVGSAEVDDRRVITFLLTSDPYRTVNFEGKDKKTSAKMTETTTDIEVRVFPSEYEGVNTVEVVDHELYNLKPLAIDHRSTPDHLVVRNAVQESGLKGLKQAVGNANFRMHTKDKIMVATRDPRAFQWAMYQNIRNREQYHSMPHDIQQWRAGINAHLPEELTTSGAMNSDQLREWLHQARHNGRGTRFLDRVLPRGFGY